MREGLDMRLRADVPFYEKWCACSWFNGKLVVYFKDDWQKKFFLLLAEHYSTIQRRGFSGRCWIEWKCWVFGMLRHAVGVFGVTRWRQFGRIRFVGFIIYRQVINLQTLVANGKFVSRDRIIFEIGARTILSMMKHFWKPPAPPLLDLVFCCSLIIIKPNKVVKCY